MAININVTLDEILQALKDDLSFSGNADKYIKVNAGEDGFEFATVSGGGGTWGIITGTLSDQTDLQSALDDKQDRLVSATNIKTIDSVSLLGSGNISTAKVWGDIGGTLSDQTDLQDALDLKANSADLATVATSGAYSDLSGTPSLATVATSGAYSDLSGTPSIPSDIGDLADVDTTTTSPTDGQALVWNDTDGEWQPDTLTASAAWGGITGTLSDQTDLQDALNLLAPLDDPTFTTKISTPIAQATSSAGLVLRNNAGTSVLTLGAGGGTGATFAGGVNIGGTLDVDQTISSNTTIASIGFTRSDLGTSGAFDFKSRSVTTEFELDYDGDKFRLGVRSDRAFIQTDNTDELNIEGGRGVEITNIISPTLVGAALRVKSNTTDAITQIIQSAASQTVDMLQFRNSAETVISKFDVTGAWTPPSLADASAANGTVYYSTDQSKLVYKDSGGVVNDLY